MSARVLQPRLCPQRWIASSTVALALLVWMAGVNRAEIFLPADDSEVLETLPRVLFSGRDKLGALRRQLSENSRNVQLAAELAQQYIELGKQASDPRFYGYARAAIRPWWQAERAPAAILLLRAKLKERDHDYDRAVDDLKLLLQLQPRNVQAWIELANLYRVQGKYAESQQACDTLAAFAGRTQWLFCSIPLLAATGKAEQAYESLTAILPQARERWPSTVQWIVTMQAHVARTLGREEQAERHYREGLENDPDDKYLLRAYADYLLDHRREKEALSQLQDHLSDTGILLRAAIAAKRVGDDTSAATWLAQLETRFEEIRLRGGQPHGRFESRCALELKNDAQRALALALENWQKQKEPRDTRNVLEAAVASHDSGRAHVVLEFLRYHGTKDAVLHKLIVQLEGNE